jgi:hypothetical protein
VLAAVGVHDPLQAELGEAVVHLCARALRSPAVSFDCDRWLQMEVDSKPK